MDTMENILRVYNKQKDFYATGKTKLFAYRIELLDRLVYMIEELEDKLIEALYIDLRKASTESYMTEIGLLYNSIHMMKKNLSSWLKPQKVKTPFYLLPSKSYVQKSPYGQVLIMSAFNFPLLLSMDPLIGSIAGGNVSIIALSERTPAVNHVIISNQEKYFDSKSVYFYVSSKEKNTNILSHPFDKIFFTGSSQVGKIVLGAASKFLTPVTLELGGKSPAIVTKSATISLTAKKIAWGKFLNAGQVCVAPDYLLLDIHVAEDFITHLIKAIQVFYGEAPQKSKDYGRLIHEEEVDRLGSILGKDKDLLIYGGKIDRKDKFISPTILLTSIKEIKNRPIASMENEIFGPILPIIVYKNMKEAVDLIESLPHPLAFYAFTNNKKEATYLLQTLSFGGACINDTIMQLTNYNLPFGGVGNSGMGAYHGKASLDTFTHDKSILHRSSIVDVPIMYPPYSSNKEKIMRHIF